MKNNIPKEIVITGLLCLTALEVVALYHGINGTLFTIVVGVIAMSIGVVIPTPKVK